MKVAMKQEIVEITERIIARSAATRKEYLAKNRCSKIKLPFIVQAYPVEI